MHESTLPYRLPRKPYHLSCDIKLNAQSYAFNLNQYYKNPISINDYLFAELLFIMVEFE